VKEDNADVFKIEVANGKITISRNGTTFMTRYWGNRAHGFLESQRQAWRDKLSGLQAGEFWRDADAYVSELGKKEREKEAEQTATQNESEDNANAEPTE
jgi:hypothetical protein